MKKLLFLGFILLILTACQSPVSAPKVNQQENLVAYTISIDQVKQGDITYKKLVINNHQDYTKENIVDKSKKFLDDIATKEDLKQYSEISIIFYDKNNKIFCSVDGRTFEINYAK